MEGRNNTDNLSLIIISIFYFAFKYRQYDNTTNISILIFTLTFLLLPYTNQRGERPGVIMNHKKKNPRKENLL